MIALVITIIVLLILAGVTIATLTGENGILTRASDAREQTEIANVIEQAKTDILGIQAEKKDGNITKGELKTVLDKYFDDIPEDFSIDDVFTTKDEYGNHEIAVSEIYNGNLGGTQEVISKTESYVGCYADIDSDGNPDGIIYADLAIGNTGTGQWGDDEDGSTNYTIPIEENLKDYYISNSDYGPLLSPTETGNDRFYIMALSDIDENSYYWYKNAYGNMNEEDILTSGDFGSGKTNTETMIEKWNNTEYGKQDSNDVWGIIQSQVAEGWFVPSKEEWAAFAGELGDYAYIWINNDVYWSSTQESTTHASAINFRSAFIDGYSLDNGMAPSYVYVRLSKTF